MEQLLFILFVLFSIGSAILERRKRAKQLEEAQRKADERRRRRHEMGEDEEDSPVPAFDEEEEEEWGGWPFPAGGEPFERPQRQAHPARRPAPAPGTATEEHAEPGPVAPSAETEPAGPVTDVRSLLDEIERRSRQAEARARAEEERAMERARQAQQAARQPPQPAGELMQRKLSRSMRPSRPARLRRRRASPWRLTPPTARRAVVYAEILGPCKAERDDEERWS